MYACYAMNKDAQILQIALITIKLFSDFIYMNIKHAKQTMHQILILTLIETPKRPKARYNVFCHEIIS